MDSQLITQEPSVAVMLQGMLAGVQASGVTSQSVEVLKGMMDLYERNEARQSAKDFAEALAALQAECGSIQATTVVQNRDGTERYKFARFEHIMARVQPLLAKHGFSHSFDTVSETGRLTAFFKLTHKGGGSSTNQFQITVSKGVGTNSAQDDMGAKSYAKRGAVCDGLGIVISQDDDARNLGGPITREQASDLRERAEACGANKFALLRMAGKDVGQFEDIPTSKLELIESGLTEKERSMER